MDKKDRNKSPIYKEVINRITKYIVNQISNIKVDQSQVHRKNNNIMNIAPVIVLILCLNLTACSLSSFSSRSSSKNKSKLSRNGNDEEWDGDWGKTELKAEAIGGEVAGREPTVLPSLNVTENRADLLHEFSVSNDNLEQFQEKYPENQHASELKQTSDMKRTNSGHRNNNQHKGVALGGATGLKSSLFAPAESGPLFIPKKTIKDTSDNLLVKGNDKRRLATLEGNANKSLLDNKKNVSAIKGSDSAAPASQNSGPSFGEQVGGGADTSGLSGIDLNAKYPEDPTYPALYKEYDKKSVDVWKQFHPQIYVGEQIDFSLKYLGITCGSIMLKSVGVAKLGDLMSYHIYARVKSAEFYESFYKLDDYVESFVDVRNFLPIKYTLIQKESGQNVDDLQLFDMSKFTNLFWYKRVKKEEVKKDEKKIFLPKMVQDSFSALFFIRGLPLKVGDKYEFPIVTRGTVWILKAAVTKEENIIMHGRNYYAVKIEAETHFPGVLKKRGDIYFWYSRDRWKIPLKFMAKVKIGNVEGEIVRYLEGERPRNK